MDIKAVATQKHKHKATHFKTKDYHTNAANKCLKINLSLCNALIGASYSQPAITLFLIESQEQDKTMQLRVEDYFKVPL